MRELRDNSQPMRSLVFSSPGVREDPEDRLRPGGGAAQDCGVPGDGRQAKPQGLMVEKWAGTLLRSVPGQT